MICFEFWILFIELKFELVIGISIFFKFRTRSWAFPKNDRALEGGVQYPLSHFWKYEYPIFNFRNNKYPDFKECNIPFNFWRKGEDYTIIMSMIFLQIRAIFFTQWYHLIWILDIGIIVNTTPWQGKFFQILASHVRFTGTN